jgi:hypothetical protein
MKQHFLQTPARVIAGVALMFGSALTGGADDSTAAPLGAVPAAPTSQVQLSYGATEVTQLAKAKVADDTIVAFVQNSGRAYSLTAPEILALRSEGVSDRVITAMLEEQTKKQTDAAARSAAAAPLAPQPDTVSQPAPVPAAPATTYAPAPAVTYVQTVPAYAPASTVYVPYAAPTYYYAPYYGYSYPAVSLSLGFGFGGYYGGHYHGGGGFHGGRR